MTNAILTRETAFKIRSTWVAMHNRCSSSSVPGKKNSYEGCSVHRDWINLPNFQAWMLEQDFQEKCLDKDILVFDNKVYSEETCIFVTPALNVQLRAYPNKSLPLGVRESSQGYYSLISAQGEKVLLGYYDTPYKAHRMWQVVKSEYLADYPLDNESPSLRPRLRIALDYRAQRIRDDLKNRRFTIRP